MQTTARFDSQCKDMKCKVGAMWRGKKAGISLSQAVPSKKFLDRKKQKPSWLFDGKLRFLQVFS